MDLIYKLGNTILQQYPIFLAQLRYFITRLESELGALRCRNWTLRSHYVIPLRRGNIAECLLTESSLIKSHMLLIFKLLRFTTISYKIS